MNTGEWTTQWAILQPDAPCIKSGDTELSYSEFNRRINRLCHALLDAGVNQGDRIAALMGNGNVFLEIFFAASKIGAIMVPLNFRLAPAELACILADSSPNMLFYSPEFSKLVHALRDKMPGVKSLICETQGGTEGDREYEVWTEDYSTDEPTVPAEVNLKDPHLIIYTSGTTGEPKGAVITHENTQWNAVHYLHTYRCGHSHVTACCAPFFHVGGLLCSAVPNIYVGAKLVIQRFFDPAKILELIQDNRVNSMLGIPVMYMFMAQTPEFAEADLSSIELFVAGGSPCSTSLIDIYRKKGVLFSQGYGMSEAPVITALPPEDCLSKVGSCGKPMFHMSVKVVDANDHEVATGETGEIISKGPVVTPEYWRKPEATSETIHEGWIHTGDMGCFDAEGYLYIKDRKKEMYISGGENVYPAEVENVMMSFPQVADVAVIGMPDPKWGETGLAIVIKAPNAEVTGQELMDACQGRLASYKIPKKVVFTDELPRTPSGKPLKKALRAQYLKA